MTPLLIDFAAPPSSEREHGTNERLFGESDDPVDILMRREITIGINLRGMPLDANTREKLAITLNIDLGLD